MKFAFTPEQYEFRRMLRSFFDRKSPEAEVRRLMETEQGYDVAVWKQMSDELGLQGLIIPEQYDGSGFSAIELGLVLEEMGRAVACTPFFSTVVLGANTLLCTDDEHARSSYLPGIAAGETLATLAFVEEDGQWRSSDATTAATQTEDGWQLTGSKMFVVDGHIADLLLVTAQSPRGLSLFAVDGNAAGITRTLLPTIDMTRKQAHVEFSAARAALIGEEGSAREVLDRVLDLAAVALAAEQVGGAQAVLDSAVQYAKDRVQFGRPIGSFQAIKHKCAEMLFQVESAKSIAYYGAECVEANSADVSEVAAHAKSYCSDVYVNAAAENIQIHGGIGFTWEHAAHLYFRRAKSSEVLLGHPAEWRDILADRLAISAVST